MTSNDIQDLINTAQVEPTAQTVDRLLDICKALNERIDTLKRELELEKKWRASIQQGKGGLP